VCAEKLKQDVMRMPRYLKTVTVRSGTPPTRITVSAIAERRLSNTMTSVFARLDKKR
jgi:hypothetical protein